MTRVHSMRFRCIPIVLVAALVVIPGVSLADTLYLNSGVRIHGKVAERADGNFTVEIDGKTTTYRKTEVKSVESNSKTGKWDREAFEAKHAQIQQERLEVTGLSTDERRRVDQYLKGYMQPGPSRLRAREALTLIAKDIDITKYLNYLYPRVEHYNAAQILDLMYYLTGPLVRNQAREALEHEYYEVRAKGIEILGALNDSESSSAIVRGLVDTSFEVRIIACNSVAQLNIKDASLCLIELLTFPDKRVSNVSADALRALWADQLGDTAPRSVDDWKDFVGKNMGVDSKRITLASLAPLVLPEEEFVEE